MVWTPWGSEELETSRDIPINTGLSNPIYKTNATSTTKYNLLTFFPKSLFEQYRRVANWYFTIVASLSLTPFTPVRAWTTWVPLGIVLGVSLIKEAIEDYKRYTADVEVNNRTVQVLNVETKTFEPKAWREIKVGEIVEVLRDSYFPADLLFLSAENEEGICYIETMNLDGETNLKIKKCLDCTKDLRRDTLCTLSNAVIQCEPPNSRLYQFTGNLTGLGEVIPINPAALLLRGCSLRNIERAYGAVIYAGHDSKVFMNATSAPSKRSRIEQIVDKIIFFMFGLLFAFCIIGSIYDARWLQVNLNNNWYLAPQYTSVQYNPATPAVNGMTNFVTCFILYGYLIPISLYVSIEVVKIIQSMVFISWDLDMYHAETDTPAIARTSNINEELGMVNTILSDKTGTLTRNVMEFFKCSIAGISYGAGVTEIERSNMIRRGQPVAITENPGLAQYRERYFNFYDKRIMEGAWVNAEDSHIIEMFLRLLAVCHTVIPDGPIVEKDIKYEAESPDESALVVAAKALGFFFFKRTNSGITVRERTATGIADVEYEVLNILEFNSTRKRMSVIVRDSQGKLYIFCKGADTVIYERLDNKNPQNKRLKEPTSLHMEEYGSAGLRTLCLSYAELDPGFYDEWQQGYFAAKTSLQDRDAKVAEVSEQIERNLVLLGCTAIEDKLQEGVPESISTLAAAGIRLWVLTGDKMETAINIGFACSLITEEMQQFIITAYFPEIEALEEAGKSDEADMKANEKVELQLKQVELEIRKGARSDIEFAIVIDGKALSYALSKRLAPLFLRCGLKCQAVICCRVSPLQKAQVTALVKSHGDVTLAIGDGANDVGMIQKAHIGVGISGQEGMQAVMASDFAIAQFRFLTPLLLVHGRYCYKRMTRMICYFFYKNLFFGITIFVFNAFTNFSGQYMYSDVYMTLFNVIFTALTPIVVGLFDKDVDKHMCLKYPALYKEGQRNAHFGLRSITGWLLTAVLQCAITVIIIFIGCVPTTVPRSTGQPYGQYEVGVVMFSCIIITVHFQIVTINEQWTWLHHLSIWLSQVVWWVFLLAFNSITLSISADLYWLFLGVVAWNPQYWLYILVVPIACLLPDFFFRSVRRHLYPYDHELVMEEQLMERLAERERLKKMRKDEEAAVLNGTAGNNDLRPPLIEPVYHVFDTSRARAGFLPAYDPNSKYYTNMDRPTQSEMTKVRNPVLDNLDATMMNIQRQSTLDAGAAVMRQQPTQSPAMHDSSKMGVIGSAGTANGVQNRYPTTSTQVQSRGSINLLLAGYQGQSCGQTSPPPHHDQQVHQDSR